MKNTILGLFATALLLSTFLVLADGRPTGIRIGHVASNGVNVEIGVTITGTNQYYDGGRWVDNASSVWLGNDFYGAFGTWSSMYDGAGNTFPKAIDWGDGNYLRDTRLFGPSGGPFTGTFVHSYAAAGTYLITVGDAYGPDSAQSPMQAKGTVPFTGNPITGSTRYVQHYFTFQGDPPGYNTWNYKSPRLLAITANALVGPSAIPALNLYGLAALALVLLGTGVLLVRGRPGATT